MAEIKIGKSVGKIKEFFKYSKLSDWLYFGDTLSRWPVKTAISAQAGSSKSRAVPSREPATSRVASALKATSVQ